MAASGQPSDAANAGGWRVPQLPGYWGGALWDEPFVAGADAADAVTASGQPLDAANACGPPGVVGWLEAFRMNEVAVVGAAAFAVAASGKCWMQVLGTCACEGRATVCGRTAGCSNPPHTHSPMLAGGGKAESAAQEANSVRPTTFKALVGKGHPEFSSGRQQVCVEGEGGCIGGSEGSW